MSADDRKRWNEKYAKREKPSLVPPDEWLVEAMRLIEADESSSTAARRALDVACGLGHNAIWLAGQGWNCDAVDISINGLRLAQRSAAANDAHVGWIEADLDAWVPAANTYDLVTVFRFLDRKSVPRIVQTALRPGGWLVYETFSSAQCGRSDNHINNPAFTLAAGELSAIFPNLEVIADREVVLDDRTVRRFLGRRHATPG